MLLINNKYPLMECGHTANATDDHGNPCCAICIGIIRGADKIDKNPPNLKGREAICDYCHKKAKSSFALPFFKSWPNRDADTYYCGCRGWD